MTSLDQLDRSVNPTDIRIQVQANLLIISTGLKGTSGRSNLYGREQVNKFSKSSAIRMRRYLRTCDADYRVLGTLTYPHGYPTNGRIVKRHFKVLCERIKRLPEWSAMLRSSTFGRRPSLFWFLEFQERGAPHFHFFTNIFIDKKWLASAWFYIVNSEDERHLAAGTRIEGIRSGRAGTAAYASKYAAKAEQKSVPVDYQNCGRFWGIVGSRTCVAADFLLNLELRRDQGIKTSLKLLGAVIREGLMLRDCISLPRRGSTTVIVLKDPAFQQAIFTKVRILETKAACMGAPYLLLPHHLPEDHYADGLLFQAEPVAA